MRSQKFAEAKLRYYGAPVPDRLKHGKGTYAAQVYGCDCKKCLPSGRRKAAKGQGMPRKERQAKLRKAKWGKPVPAGTKHGIYTAKVYGCTCDICTTIKRAATHRQRSAWRKTATGVWSSSTDSTGASLDVVHWPPVGHGAWTCPSCGQLFRRRPPKEVRLAA